METTSGYTRSQLTAWHPGTATDALSALEGLADQVEDHFGALNLRLANLPDTGGWKGDAHTAAVDKMTQVKNHATTRADALRALHAGGVAALANLDTYRIRLLANAQYAETDGLIVTDNWTVMPGSTAIEQSVVDEWSHELSNGLAAVATADADAATAIREAAATLTESNIQGFLPIALAGLGIAVEVAAYALVAGGVVTGAAVIAYLLDKFGGIASPSEILDHIPSEFLSDNGPGEWVDVNRDGVPEHSKAYEEQVTGASSGTEYEVEGVKFDGWEAGEGDEPGTLIEAKGPGYDQFLDKDGNFQPWWKGGDSLVDQANRQVDAAEATGDDTVIEWRVAEQRSASAIRELLRENEIVDVDVVFVPPE
ncbi:Tox-REase-5 domain-containing protein [Rhodococcus sp. HNM0569]|uniref:Tox-REase-5 domain-containing protein n=1 Tax=Rhodococcus sp. HNM0569 TaxID=2716340 RepID=UPI00146B988A|nr:Tox-REase-5 domain-containing protein [Rhodococcus sp. HNM0569]NLU84338.1 hypothetical protein [Rhodococcus sp. HNM0569]